MKDVDWLRASASAERVAEIAGETDSELLFAWMLTRLDDAGVSASPAGPETDRALGRSPGRGVNVQASVFNFLLSDGATTYAHRFGRSMFLLERQPEDTVVSSRTSRDGTVLETPWSPRRSAVFVASERITDEPWQSIEDGTLLRIERIPSPTWRLVAT